MNAVKIIAIVLIVVGVLGLAYGGLSFTKDRHEMQMGTLSMTIEETQTVNIPMWAGIAAVLVGGGLLFAPTRKS